MERKKKILELSPRTNTRHTSVWVCVCVCVRTVFRFHSNNGTGKCGVSVLNVAACTRVLVCLRACVFNLCAAPRATKANAATSAVKQACTAEAGAFV